MTSIRKALIIGGGIAGPAAAMALQKAGVASVVYEAHSKGSEGVGVFLTLASNGIDALRVLGAEAPALAAGFPTPGITLRSGSGKRLGQSRTGGTLADGTTSQTLARADLYRVLHEEATSRGHGIHSTVRRIIDPAAPSPTYCGLITTGGYARDIHLDTEPGSYEMIFGKRAFFGYATAPDGDTWWFANLPRHAEPARGELEATSAQDWKRELLHLFGQDAGPAVALIQAAPALMPMWPIHAIPHLPTWHHERMIVIGDAHTPSPPPPDRAPPSPSRTRSSWPSACVTCPPRKRRSADSKPLAGPARSPSSSGPPGSTTAKPPARSPGRFATRCSPRF